LTSAAPHNLGVAVDWHEMYMHELMVGSTTHYVIPAFVYDTPRIPDRPSIPGVASSVTQRLWIVAPSGVCFNDVENAPAASNASQAASPVPEV